MKVEKRYPPTYFNSAIVLMIVSHFIFPIIYLIIGYWRLLGLLPILIGIYLNLAADKSLRKNNTTVKPGEESEALITDGVFSISRNPMYVGMAFILLGIAILLGSVSTFFIIPIFVYIINKKFVIIEEKMLTEKFGRKWISYKEKTRSWI